MPDPMMMTFSNDLTRWFTDVQAGVAQAPRLDPTASLVDNVRRLDLAHGCPDRVARFLDAVPPGIAAAFVAAVGSALSGAATVQFAWLPGYDFELTVSDVRREARLVSIVLRSPFAADVAPPAEAGA